MGTGCIGAFAWAGILQLGHGSRACCTDNEAGAQSAACSLWMEIDSKSIMWFPKFGGEPRTGLTCSSSIAIVTTVKQPVTFIQTEVSLTTTTLLRSRMRRKSHVRFCSRAGVVTLRLRQHLITQIVRGGA